MTQEDKKLLLKDLCARLPYKIKVQMPDEYCGYTSTIDSIDIDGFVTNIEGAFVEIENIKPYLFPLSSMTEEQKREYDSIIYSGIELHSERYYDVIDIDEFEVLMDFYHKNHFDYRGLIPMDLAKDATNLNIY